MTIFTLPEGYSFEPPSEEGTGVLSDIPAMTEYGGATISQDWDARGVHFVGCCAKNPAGLFRFRIFCEDAPELWREVPIEHDCDGRGSIAVSVYDGQMRWIAWRGSGQHFGGIVPEAVAFPPYGTNSGAAGPRITNPEHMIELWAPDYVDQAEVLDGQLHVRLNKLKAAARQLQRLIRQLGGYT